MPADEFDLDAYFARIGYQGSRVPSLETLNSVIAAHTQTIPFENLDVLLGRPILLDAASLQQKLIHQRRGGYCFEQNGLLLLALQSLHFDVQPMSARVRLDAPRDFIPPRTHLFLRVQLQDASWLADVGVGSSSPTTAVNLAEGVETGTSHELHRIVKENGVYFHQGSYGTEWHDIYEFTLEQMPLIDREVSNWYTSTSPRSRFRQHLLVSRSAGAAGRHTILDDQFSRRAADGVATKHKITSKSELFEILSQYFGLHLDHSLPLHLPAVTEQEAVQALPDTDEGN